MFHSKRSSVGSKKPKTTPPITYQSGTSIFSLIKDSETVQIAGVTPISQYPINNAKKEEEIRDSSFATFINANEIEETEDQQIPTTYVPVDWSLKTKLRILSPTVVQGNGLKMSGASGVTR